ncbi:nuclear protein 96-domain-containing protein [Stachybotrys elegans]|uniref:Nuclear protein 96-domain-containing protein n=1 Tax=Stachybotrys elegans TaxID=80388 RepID=A0A8K0SQ23_9HYPO|nr:nuclear protein 96-domain-containing protein [Stachybotrys elegans]
MSFGGGGFGGFGANNNNNNQSTTFGGFGQNNNTNTTGSAFGGGNTGGFGQSNTGGGMFGNNTNTASTGGFGSGPAFGSNTAGGFGAKPAFGASTTTGSSGLFGSTANNTTSATPAFGGGFGATTNTTTASPFGGGTTTGGGIFGASNANKPAFGAATTTPASTGLFGGATTGGFGTGGFGATNNPGLGGGGGDPPGTAVTPFQAFAEKEPNSTSNQSNAFQNIVFQEAYKKWSPEELRLVDYTQGRRHGNASGGGAFGVSSNFGGGFGANNQTTTSAFGATPSTNTTTTGGGIFGNNNNNTNTTTSAFGGTAFGANNTNNSTAGSGLFGANKPSLFGATNQTQTTGGGIFGNTGGNAFGATNNTGTGFGQTANNTTGGTGLFGANNQANKPAGTGFSFGNTNNNNTTNSAFGGTTNNAFGNAANNTTAGSGLFGGGNNNNTQTGAGGIFGNNNNQQQQGNTGAFGGGFGQQNTNQATGTSLFGNNQQKPATGLFGATQTNNASGGLFGNNNTQQQTTSAFGGGNAAAGGGIFGSKPATGTGTSLFGNNNTTANTGTGLFGGLGANNQTQQQTGGGIFGGANNQQQKPSLFGTSQPAGGGIFGGQANQNQGSSLFGSTNQQQTGGFGSSLLGNSQQANNAPQGLTANLSDVSAYGSPSLFSSVGGNEVPNPGPLATPLNGSAKPRRGSVIPMYRLAPASASRFNTPQKRGFGFSYSTYGTPNASPSSSVTSTPGTLGRSLLGSSTSTSLSRSMSTNNLRRAYNGDDSILAPGAFSSSSGPRWYGSTGSKKLVINRDIRSDLFSTPQKDRTSDNGTVSRKLAKRVSFDTSNVEMEEGSTPVRALPEPEHASPQADETPRQSKTINGTNGSKAPEMEQVQGNELAIVHEESNTAPAASSPAPGADRAPGVYWMRPSREELQEMNRIQRTKVDGFEVGREGVGSVSFLTPVDVSGIELEDLCGGIIQLEPRSATVYPMSAKKPPRGKGLNVPAKISLEQSWPRGGREKKNVDSSKLLKKHIERLKRIPDTTFIDYKEDTGVWTFRVEHFTTYGLDDSDDDSSDELPDAPPTTEPAHFSMSQQLALDASTGSFMSDDTFNFRQRKALPGAFDEEQAQDVMETDVAPRESFLGVSSVDSAPNNVRLTFEDEEEETAVQMGEEYDSSDNEDMARSSIGQHLATELDDVSLAEEEEMIRETPGGVLRARMRAVKESVGPVQLEVADGDDWMEMLRKTVSPVKRDRQLLRELNESPTRRTGTLIDLDKDDGDDNFASSIWKKSLARPDKKDNGPGKHLGMDKGRGFATSIDLMNSLFEKPKPMAQSMRASVSSKGFPKWPYERQDKNVTIDEGEQAYHDASRPTWGPNEVLTLTRSLETIKAGHAGREPNGLLNFQKSGIQTSKQDVRLARFSAESSKKYLRVQDGMTDIRVVDGVPMAALRVSKIKDVFHNQDMNNPASIHEKQVWELASILFDDIPGTSSLDQDGVRRAALSKFWMELVEQASSRAIGLAGSSEEKAVACLAGHRVTEACKHLLEGKNFRLATLVSLIGTDDAAKKEMKEQVDAWHQSKMLSEFSEAIRTIYELLGGNVCVCKGMKGVPVEDRLDSFVISKKFGLDWKQSFGLRLWYALSRNDDLPMAVRLFKQDIDQDKEELPQPWYAEQGIKPLWDDFSAGTRQDLLWGLLQLFADADLPLEAVLQPENSQLSPLDMRLCWQLGLTLSSNGKASYGDDAARKANAATIAYASQLNSAGEWLEAVFVLLHLTDPLLRTKAIQEHLCRHASKIGNETSQEFGILTEKFQIPAQWIWEALALYMRSVKKDATGEVQCLLRAELFVEAHRVLVQQVAPSAIIERDYAGLSHLIAQFEGRQDQIAEWQAGGEIYSQFLNLLEHRSRSEDPAPALLERLLAGLHSMNEGMGETEIVRYAAVSDMADETAKEIMKLGQKKKDNEFRSRILNLPLTQDRLLYYSVDLSLDRYREVMSH